MAHAANLDKQHLNTIHTTQGAQQLGNHIGNQRNNITQTVHRGSQQFGDHVARGAQQLGNHIGNQRDNINQAVHRGNQQLSVHANAIHTNVTQGIHQLGDHIGNKYNQLDSPEKLEQLKESTDHQLNNRRGGTRKRKHNKRQKTHRKKRGGGGDYSIRAIEAMIKAQLKKNRKPRKHKATTQKIDPSVILKNRSRIKSYPNKSPGKGGRKTKRRKR